MESKTGWEGGIDEAYISAEEEVSLNTVLLNEGPGVRRYANL